VGDCVAAVSTITFSARLRLSQAEFEAQATRAAYISGVAGALGVAESSVAIVSVVEQSTGRRRKLLLTSVVVETSVIVAADQAAIVADRITTDNLNSALSSAGISVEEVSSISTVTGSAALSGQAIAGVAVAGVVLLAAALWRVLRKSGRVLDYNLQALIADSIKDLGDAFRVEDDAKFSPTDLVFGNFDEATTTLDHFLCVDRADMSAIFANPELAIVQEIQLAGTESDKVCAASHR